MKALIVCMVAFMLGAVILTCCGGCANRSKTLKLQSPIDNLNLQLDLQPPIIDNGTHDRYYLQ
jgi:hypothetical protein